MKTKGVPVWELYLEWLVLAVAVILFIYFVGSQFVGAPNSLTLEGKQLSPGEVDEYLDGIARSINGNLSGSSPPAVVIEDPKASLPEVQAMLNSGVSPESTWELPLISALDPHDSADLSAEIASGLPYLVPQPPSSSQVVTEQFFNTVTPNTREEYASLAEHLPAEAPFDVTWVTAKSSVDLADLLVLYKDGIASEARPYRPNWFDGRVDVLDVIVEREELVDGAWTNSIILDPLESQVSIREAIKGSKNTSQRDQLLAQARDKQQQDSMLRPAFYPVREQTSWRLDSDAASAAIDSSETKAEKNIRAYKGYLEDQLKLESEWEKLNCDSVDLGSVGSGTGGVGSSDSDAAPGMSGMSGGEGSGGVNNAQQDEELAVCRRLNAQLLSVRQKLANLKRRLENDGVNLESLEIQVDLSDLKESTSVEMWVHDISAVPDHIYRYRMRAELYNPLFGRKLSLQPEQFPLAEKLTVSTPWSDFSAPIDVQPPLVFYVTNASSAEQQGQSGLGLNLGQARVEVHRFYDGRWWGQNFAVEPGDLVGFAKKAGEEGREVDFATNWFVLDVISNLEAAADPAKVRARMAAHVLLQRDDRIEQFEVRNPSEDSENWVRAELLDFEDAAPLQQQEEMTDDSQPGRDPGGGRGGGNTGGGDAGGGRGGGGPGGGRGGGNPGGGRGGGGLSGPG
ncbi:MAG: hypothetical protein P8J86_12510 [Phycisphaerales bacterium]|nr:hypothetical protein [Phycisphaerales bacterium]